MGIDVNDPNELNDLGASTEHEEIRNLMFNRLSEWARRLSQRTTMSANDVITEKKRSGRRGIVLGAWNESDMPKELTQCYLDPSDRT